MRSFCIILLAVFLSSCSQTTEFSSLVKRNGKFYAVNSQTPYTGTFVKSSPNKNADFVLMEGAIKNGYFDGEIKNYYTNGQLKNVTGYKNQKFHGVRSNYFSNGQVQFTENYVDGKLNGERKEFSNNGRELLDEFYENGVRERAFIKYNNKGQLVEVGNYSKGIKVGSWDYLKNNRKITETYNEKGVLDGKYRVKFTSYALPSWIDGQKNVTKSYTTNGSYKKGQKDGVWTTSEQNGRIVHELSYENGKPKFFEGEWQVHDTQRNAKYFMKYDNGKLYTKQTQSDSYKMIGTYKIDEGRNYLTINNGRNLSYRYGLLKKDEYQLSSKKYIAKKVN